MHGTRMHRHTHVHTDTHSASSSYCSRLLCILSVLQYFRCLLRHVFCTLRSTHAQKYRRVYCSVLSSAWPEVWRVCVCVCVYVCVCVQDCQVYSNSGEGVLVKGGAAPSVTDCDIHDNKGWGLSIQVCVCVCVCVCQCVQVCLPAVWLCGG